MNAWRRIAGRERASGTVEAWEIERWMVRRLAVELELDPEEIDVSVPVDRYGLDSRTAAALSGGSASGR